ncbi:unnamed protein product, partial [Meganyctiphanes norvegica]
MKHLESVISSIGDQTDGEDVKIAAPHPRDLPVSQQVHPAGQVGRVSGYEREVGLHVCKVRLGSAHHPAPVLIQALVHDNTCSLCGEHEQCHAEAPGKDNLAWHHYPPKAAAAAEADSDADFAAAESLDAELQMVFLFF